MAWIEHTGGAMPVGAKVSVRVITRDGWQSPVARWAGRYDRHGDFPAHWKHRPGLMPDADDIVAYRIVEPMA